MIREPAVVGMALPRALRVLEAAGCARVQVADITLGRAQAWPEVRVIRQSRQEGIPFLVVCRFPQAL